MISSAGPPPAGRAAVLFVYDFIYDGVALLNGGGEKQAPIAAYLNYLVYDEQFAIKDYGFTPVPENMSMDSITMTLSGLRAEQNGYIFIYLSNESTTGEPVYFDDLKVTHKSNIIQVSDYYPFGLQHAVSWTRPDAEVIPNPYLYNAGTELNAATGLYETPLRTYDPAVGRFSGMDIYASTYHSMTPYQYGANDPVYYNDPTGALLGDLYGEDEGAGGMLYHVDGGPGMRGGGSSSRFRGRSSWSWYDRNPGETSYDKILENEILKNGDWESIGLAYKDGKIGYWETQMVGIDYSTLSQWGSSKDYELERLLATMSFSPVFVPLEIAQSGGVTSDWIIQSGHEITAGAQAAGYFKGGLGAIVNLGSVVLSQDVKGKGLKSKYNVSGNPIFQQEIGASAIIGASYKRTLQFDESIGFFDGSYEWEQHQLSVGLLGVIDFTWTWDGNGNLQSRFIGVDLELQLAIGLGINLNILKAGHLKQYGN